MFIEDIEDRKIKVVEEVNYYDNDDNDYSLHDYIDLLDENMRLVYGNASANPVGDYDDGDDDYDFEPVKLDDNDDDSVDDSDLFDKGKVNDKDHNVNEGLPKSYDTFEKVGKEIEEMNKILDQVITVYIKDIKGITAVKGINTDDMLLDEYIDSKIFNTAVKVSITDDKQGYNLLDLDTVDKGVNTEVDKGVNTDLYKEDLDRLVESRTEAKRGVELIMEQELVIDGPISPKKESLSSNEVDNTKTNKVLVILIH